MKRTLVIGLSLIGLISCGSGEHTKLCKKDAGTFVYKKVKGNGFYHAQCNSFCWGQFLDTYQRTGLDFMEFDNKKTYSTAYIADTGYWRYFIAEKGNPFCNMKIQKKLDGYVNPDEFTAEFRESKCVAAKKIPDIEAQYEYVNTSSVIDVSSIFGTKILKDNLDVLDRDTGELLGRTTQYSKDLIPGTPNEGGWKGCKYYAKPIKGNVYELVIIPNLGE